MKSDDCVHECKSCHYLTTCLPRCEGDQKYAPKLCAVCRPDLYLKRAA